MQSKWHVALNYSELSTVLAALRLFQKLPREDVSRIMPHFADVPPLTADQIDALCQRMGRRGRVKP